MRSQRTGAVQVLVGLGYLTLLVVVLQALMQLRNFMQMQGSVAGFRGQILVYVLLGLLVAAFTLWGSRNRLGSALVTAVLTVVVLTSFGAFFQVRWLESLWHQLGFMSNTSLPAEIACDICRLGR